MPYALTGIDDRQFARRLGRIRAEYLEMPGLQLTLPQACRLWHLDAFMSSNLLGALVDAKFLTRTSSGVYVRADQN